MTELKPCPFCGGKAEFIHVYPPFGRRRLSVVQCPHCRCNSGKWGRSDKAIKSWNRRVVRTAIEEKRGHWIEANDSYNRISGRCSVCGWESHMYEDDVVGMDFCPNCGAKMDGKGDGNG